MLSNIFRRPLRMNTESKPVRAPVDGVQSQERQQQRDEAAHGGAQGAGLPQRRQQPGRRQQQRGYGGAVCQQEQDRPLEDDGQHLQVAGAVCLTCVRVQSAQMNRQRTLLQCRLTRQKGIDYA